MTMLIFERSYDNFMILSYDKVMITNFQSQNLRHLEKNKKRSPNCTLSQN